MISNIDIYDLHIILLILEKQRKIWFERCSINLVSYLACLNVIDDNKFKVCILIGDLWIYKKL